jgi:hypothetical protein
LKSVTSDGISCDLTDIASDTDNARNKNAALITFIFGFRPCVRSSMAWNRCVSYNITIHANGRIATPVLTHDRAQSELRGT